MDIQTILVPVDFSSGSLQVTRQAAALARKLGAQLLVLHVAALPAGLTPQTQLHPPGADSTAGELLAADAAAHLAAFVDAARQLGAQARAVVELGPVVPTILAATTRYRADLVMLSTHGRSSLARLLLGSVAEGVVHGSPVPVMLVRRDAQGRAEDGESALEKQIAAESEG
jgi:universal stress protein A